MACRKSVEDSVEAAYFQWKLTLDDSIFRPPCNELMYGPLSSTYSLSPRILVKAEILDSLLWQVRKNDMLRWVFPRIIEGLMQPIMIQPINPYWSIPDSESNYRVHTFACDFHKCLESLESLIALFLNNLSSGLGFVDIALVSAIVLSIVFQYLVGYVDKGGTKTYNPGSLEFRATYVSLLLFLGAYIWIKFRELAQRTVWRRPKKDKFGKVVKDEFGQVQYYDKWEPRFTPPREEGFGKHNHLPLGGYDTHRDAEVVCQVAGFYYGKDEGVVVLADGSHFFIPVMSEQERSLCGEEKRKWVSAEARVVFESFKETAAREQPRLGAHARDQVNALGSPSADQATGLSAHAANQVDAPASPRAYQAPWFSADAVDQVGAPASPSADLLAVFAFSPATTNDVFVERLAREHGLLGNIGDVEDLPNVDIPTPSSQEQLKAQLHLQKTQLEADFNRRFESLTEQHAEQYRRWEVEKSELRQENKRLKTMLQQAATPLRAFFVTSTVELESSTENC